MTEHEKYFVVTTSGGYSNCLDRGGGSVRPNCVGLAWGYMAETYGKKVFDKRPKCNAGQIYANCKPNGTGFLCSQTLHTKAMIVWGAGTDAGHVAWIENMHDGVYMIRESNYSGTFANGKYERIIYTKTPKTLYKDYKGCVYGVNF